MRIYINLLLLTSLILTSCFGTAPEESNNAPNVDAGFDQTIPLDVNSLRLTPIVKDDGLPKGSALRYSWMKQSGQGNVTFDNATIKQPTVRFSTVGVYELALTVSDGELSGSDIVIITVMG